MQSLTTWLLVVLLTTFASVREGLHLLPGLSHAVMLGDQAILLGQWQPALFDASVPPADCITACSDDPARALEEDACPICRLLGMKFAPAAPDGVVPVEISVDQPVPASENSEAAVIAVYQARAPPLV